MMKVSLFLALTLVASVSALQDAAANGGEAGPEPYSYAYQTDSHAASEQRDQQGRVTGFYTLTDADGRERRVEYVADEAGFRAKVATNEVGTKSESPANVEFVASEPTPAQYSAAQYSVSQAYQAPAQVQGAQYVRSQTYQTAAAPQVASNFGRAGYFQQQQYASRPAVYGNTGYYTTGYAANAAAPASAYGSSYNAAYGGYGGASQANQATGYTGYTTGYAPAGGYYTTGYAPASYGYTVSGAAPATTGQYYSYRSSTVNGAAAPVVPAAGAAGYSSAYRYRSSTVPVGGVATYSTGAFPVGVGASFSANGPVGVGATASRTANYQGSSNYLVLQKRAAEKEEKSN